MLILGFIREFNLSGFKSTKRMCVYLYSRYLAAELLSHVNLHLSPCPSTLLITAQLAANHRNQAASRYLSWTRNTNGICRQLAANHRNQPIFVLVSVTERQHKHLRIDGCGGGHKYDRTVLLP